MTSLEAKQYLDSFINYELKPDTAYASSLKLERVTRLLNLLGDPQKKIKILHVAGTKGKGSTCAFVASILKSAGYKVGLYTSPHLSDYKERIRVFDSVHDDKKEDGAFAGKIKEAEFCRLLEEIKPSIEKVRNKKDFGRLSFFEIYTVLALCYFYERKVDFAVLETGLGGRLDATNVVDSLVCGITPISIEHTKQLGSTLKEIAGEKAAIIKNKNQIVVVAPQEKEALHVLKKRCRQFGVTSYFVGSDIRYESSKSNLEGQILSIKSLHTEYPRLKTKLLGRHQAMNAALAIGMVESLEKFGFSLGEEVMCRGIEATQWPGRFEIVKKKPLVILDGAHNPGSCKVLVTVFRDIFPCKKAKLILGISCDKDIRGICAQLNKIAGEIIFTKASHPRAADFSCMPLNGLFQNKKVDFANNVKEALKKALESGNPNDVVLVTGSLFVVGEARGLCISRN